MGNLYIYIFFLFNFFFFKRLNLIIVRPAIVYGPGDISGISRNFYNIFFIYFFKKLLAPRLICGAVYKYLNETMEFLWDKELKINTVHVYDTVAALWHLALNGKVGEVYNLADKNETGFFF